MSVWRGFARLWLLHQVGGASRRMANRASIVRTLEIAAAVLVLLAAVLFLPILFRSPDPVVNQPLDPPVQLSRTPAPSSLSNSAQSGTKTADNASVIIAKLNSGQDAPTGQPFKVGPGGSLVSAPTTRVALLEELCRVDPTAAAAYAKTILADFRSADEWAVSLRAFARVNTGPEAKAFLEEKLRAMWNYDPWRANPSAGFLEAFDVSVYLGGTRLMPELTAFVRDHENRAVAHAAYLALDRLVINEPATALEYLLSHSGTMTGREVTRANYFARADVTDRAQRRILETYLLEPARSRAELDTFAALYPQSNYMISHNLLTPTPTPNGVSIARRDQETLMAVEAWMAQARFSSVKPHLQTIQSRLLRFAEQAR